ncbi:DNA ligase D [Noviherbaspirillum massiliense]|uniref:DNA ligase D n=1 Tax=Noviherbaspirillum massiliense TaxID=1465823 RepID=UPI0002D2663E|nr:DNA ligase D [Noviherbaspirillum massiliense]
MQDKLANYHAKRNFRITPEPHGELAAPGERLRFVVQRHDARKLHYDFRLELDGTLKSWAVPKGPSLDPAEKRLAVQVEDHPLDYIDFEGDIPEHQYGAGHVDVWDSGYWEPQGDPVAGYKAGKLKFRLDGERLRGGWALVRTRLQAGKPQWLLIKEKDEEAQAHAADGDAKPDEAPAAPAAKRKRTTRKATSSTAQEQHDAAAPTALKGARKAALPETMSAQLATLVDAVPQEGDWLYEIKYDGYRVLARVDGDEVRLFTRDGKDWTAKLPRQAEAIRALGLQSAWLDGEIVVLDKQGIPSFQLLQNAFDEKRSAQILYYLFDLPYLNGYDLRKTPLEARRELLGQMLAGAEQASLRFSAALDKPPQQLLDSACELSMEGIIGKLAGSPYVGKRSTDWIKLKCRKRQEFVIAGYTDPQGARQYFGSLLLGVYGDDGVLRYAGRVGTGFDRTTLQSTYRQLKALEQKPNPFAKLPAGVGRAHVHWIRPQLAAEVSFAEWTREGLVRQAVFHGLRIDKPAAQIRREQAASTPAKAGKAGSTKSRNDTKEAAVAGVRITHPDRVIDPRSGFTKLELARYYEQVAPRILPFLQNRPVYLLRCPEGIEGEKFFQKHRGRLPIPGVRMFDQSLDPEHAPLMAIESAEALAGAVQMGMIELHVCGATADRIDRPDCMVFDLDPDPELPWHAVTEGAHLVKVLLDELGLQSFLKTSGGKGLHLVVPLARRHEWEDVTAFSQAVAQHLARTLPARFSAKMGAQNRAGKIFVDYMRNQRQASAVCPYSVRARPGLPVATPMTWEELPETNSAAMWTVATLPMRLAQLKEDPWENYFKLRQVLTVGMRRKIGVE